MNSKKLAVSLFCVILFISLMADTEGFVDWPTEDHRKPKTVAKISCFFAPVLPSFVRMFLTLVPFPLSFCFLCFNYFIRSGLRYPLLFLPSLFLKSFFPFLPFFGFLPSLAYSLLQSFQFATAFILVRPVTVSSLMSFLAYGEMLQPSEKPYWHLTL